MDPVRLERRLARGGTAEVFAATVLAGPHAGARVAVKRLLPRHEPDPAARRMLAGEGALTAGVVHPGIVRVLAQGEIEGAPAIVMELVEGCDAARAMRVAGGTLPEPVALHVVAEVAAALAHAHGLRGADGVALGLVHRDVTPSNVLLGWDGRVKLTDFGIARTGASERTATGIVKGKEGYVAPEQAGAGGAVGPWTDAYAVGATLHALIAGAPPCPTFAAAARRFAGGPLRIDGRVSPAAEVLVRAAMELDPTARAAAETIASRARALAGDARARCSDLAAWLAPVRAETSRAGPLDGLLG